MPRCQVTQAHALGIDGAKARLMTLDGGAANKNFKLESFAWQESTSTFTFDLLVYGVKVRGWVVIAPAYVVVDTDPLPLWTTPFVWYAQSEIKAKLAEVLK